MSHRGATAGLAGSMEQRGKRTSLALLIVVSFFLIVLFSFPFFLLSLLCLLPVAVHDSDF